MEKYLTILDFNLGQVYTYYIKDNNLDEIELFESLNHDIDNCQFMYHNSKPIFDN